LDNGVRKQSKYLSQETGSLWAAVYRIRDYPVTKQKHYRVIWVLLNYYSSYWSGITVFTHVIHALF